MAIEWGANKVVVGVGGTYRVVIDLDGREGDVLEFLARTNFADNRLEQVTVP